MILPIEEPTTETVLHNDKIEVFEDALVGVTMVRIIHPHIPLTYIWLTDNINSSTFSVFLICINKTFSCGFFNHRVLVEFTLIFTDVTNFWDEFHVICHFSPSVVYDTSGGQMKRPLFDDKLPPNAILFPKDVDNIVFLCYNLS